MHVKTIAEWSAGNPGAMSFLMEILKPVDSPRARNILKKLEEAKSIRGTNLYVLWSDICNKELSKVEILCKNCPVEVLEDACSRQDYSGRDLVAQYFS